MIIKSKTVQRYIYKIHSDRFKRDDWEISLSIKEAIQNDELISLADSQLFRFIDTIEERNINIESITTIRGSIANYKEEYNNNPTKDIKENIKKAYDELYSTLFVPEYLCLVIDHKEDYEHAYKNGLKINGIGFKRLLSTTNGVKKSEIIFIHSDIWDMVNSLIDNGRNLSEPLLSAKFEAYKALVCSGSVKVSDPKGVIVVPDCKTNFKSDVIKISDDNKLPLVVRGTEDVKLNASDGFGLILPSLSKRWTKELGGEGISSGFCIRNAWTKGMVFTFDFCEFAEKVAGRYEIIDIWGNKKDIRQADMILTSSQLKLWKCYDNIEHYLGCCKQNGYSFGITKMTPSALENERRLCYQFLQSYDLSDQELDDLMQPTVSMIQDVMGLDYRKAILFLKGKNFKDDDVIESENDVGKALSISPEVINDPHIQDSIRRMLHKTIDEAKYGKLFVHGNYSLVAGDCYALCQSMFGIPVTGLLKAGEIYNRYWVDNKTDEVVCYRAPMTSEYNIRKLQISSDDTASHWFEYMKTVTVLNALDTVAYALSGLDFDGDLVFLTDNPILLRNTVDLPAIICKQKQAEKKVVKEDDLYAANIAGFGDEIGKITNRTTAMYDVRSKFEPDSDEYQELSYRIMCGQLYQQNAIDKIKGILTKPMPQYWYSKSKRPKEGKSVDYLNSISANKKPYFMRYIYPEDMKEYGKYIDKIHRKCRIQFGVSFDDLDRKEVKNEEELKFIQYYEDNMPLSTGDCIINKLCRKVEKIFDHKYKNNTSEKKLFDFSIYKSGVKIDEDIRRELSYQYQQYIKRSQNYMRRSKNERIDDGDNQSDYEVMKMDFKKNCDLICPDKQMLCDILLDICYNNKGSKQFVWDMCSKEIIHNLLGKSQGIYTYPKMSKNGDFEYGGNKYVMAKCGGDIK